MSPTTRSYDRIQSLLLALRHQRPRALAELRPDDARRRSSVAAAHVANTSRIRTLWFRRFARVEGLDRRDAALLPVEVFQVGDYVLVCDELQGRNVVVQRQARRFHESECFHRFG